MTSGGRELLKWLALVLMTGDHVNKALLSGGYPILTDVSRVVFPIFAVVLAYNLTRPDSIRPALSRLLVVGALVQPLHGLVFGYWLPVNVLLTFAAAVGMMHLWRSGWPLAAGFLFSFAGSVVDYGWVGLALTFAAWLAFSGTRWSWWLVLASFAGLCWYNGNAWALLALPLLFVGSRVRVILPRWRWAFLGYYAFHLAVLALLVGV